MRTGALYAVLLQHLQINHGHGSKTETNKQPPVANQLLIRDNPLSKVNYIDLANIAPFTLLVSQHSVLSEHRQLEIIRMNNIQNCWRACNHPHFFKAVCALDNKRHVSFDEQFFEYK